MSFHWNRFIVMGKQLILYPLTIVAIAFLAIQNKWWKIK